MTLQYLTSVRSFAAVLLSLAFLSSVSGQNATSTTDDFASKSIEELMNVDVTSVSRKEQKLSKTPAAVYVVTQENIRRSGATTIPDILRMVPGVQVAQVDANSWAISVRGFNGIYSNKLLVLVDGRTIYTPVTSGVYWNQPSVPLDTIERIEVIRGTGGTVWGANAVNGVINIITEHSRNTQGTKIVAGAGSFQTGNYQVLHGGQFGSARTYRAWGDFSQFGNLLTARGQNGHDGWHSESAGFRADLSRTAKDTFITEGNLFGTRGGQIFIPAGLAQEQSVSDRGFDVMGRWTHVHSDNSQSSLQISGSRSIRFEQGFSVQVSTTDFDFQNHHSLGFRNDIVWGLGYRLNRDEVKSTVDPLTSLRSINLYAQFLPESRTYSLFSSFFQDEIAISKNLALTVGSKMEHNAFTAFEFEPSARLAWTPTEAQTFWMAASKAVRQPSRFETAIDVHLQPAYLSQSLAISPHITGNTKFQAETVRSFEAGYRSIIGKNLFVDLSTFFSIYGQLRNTYMTTPELKVTPKLVVLSLPFMYGNGFKGQSYGGEANVTWNALSRWKLSTGYANLRTSLYATSGDLSNPGVTLPQTLAPLTAILQAAAAIRSNDAIAGTPGPQHQWTVQSYWDVTSRLHFDNFVYFVGGLPDSNIPAYTRVDASLMYKLRHGVELSIVGQNLLKPRHVEFVNTQQILPTQAVRNISAKVIWSF